MYVRVHVRIMCSILCFIEKSERTLNSCHGEQPLVLEISDISRATQREIDPVPGLIEQRAKRQPTSSVQLGVTLPTWNPHNVLSEQPNSERCLCCDVITWSWQQHHSSEQFIDLVLIHMSAR